MDVETPGGARWRQEIAERIAAARCVIVVWSEASVGPGGDFVHDEASRAQQDGKLLPVSIDRVTPPIGFGEVQSLDLVEWDGDPRDARFQDVVRAAQSMVEGTPRTPARPRPAARKRRRLAGVSGGLALVAALVGFAADVAGLQREICRVPGIRAVCRAAGLGGVPSRVEQDLWESRQPGDCELLRSYLVRFADGAYAEEATRRLQAVVPEQREEWAPATRRLPLVVPRGLELRKDENAAHEDALGRGRKEAELVCSGFATEDYRILTVDAEPESWRCEELAGGTVCGFDGKAVCELEERRACSVETCP